MWPELISILALAVTVAIAAIVPMNPFPTNGSLVLTDAKCGDRNAFLRQLLSYAAVVTAAPLILWLLVVVIR